jgi:hypothetical protein
MKPINRYPSYGPRGCLGIYSDGGKVGAIPIRSGEKIEKLKYNAGYQKIGEEFFIGGALGGDYV